MIKISGYYELNDKLNRQKERYKQDISKLQFQIKKQNEIIEALKTRNKDLKSREMYRIWLKEREKLITQLKENSTLLDEINNLKKKLTNEIELSIEDLETEVMRKK